MQIFSVQNDRHETWPRHSWPRKRPQAAFSGWLAGRRTQFQHHPCYSLERRNPFAGGSCTSRAPTPRWNSGPPDLCRSSSSRLVPPILLGRCGPRQGRTAPSLAPRPCCRSRRPSRAPLLLRSPQEHAQDRDGFAARSTCSNQGAFVFIAKAFCLRAIGSTRSVIRRHWRACDVGDRVAGGDVAFRAAHCHELAVDDVENRHRDARQAESSDVRQSIVVI